MSLIGIYGKVDFALNACSARISFAVQFGGHLYIIGQVVFSKKFLLYLNSSFIHGIYLSGMIESLLLYSWNKNCYLARQIVFSITAHSHLILHVVTLCSNRKFFS